MSQNLQAALILMVISVVIFLVGYLWAICRERADVRRLEAFKAQGPNLWGENGYAADLQRGRVNIFTVAAIVGTILLFIAFAILLKDLGHAAK